MKIFFFFFYLCKNAKIKEMKNQRIYLCLAHMSGNEIHSRGVRCQLGCSLDKANIESRPLWKPMHLQPVYKNVPSYVNGVSESLFKTGLCLPSGLCVSEEDAKYIVEQMKSLCE